MVRGCTGAELRKFHRQARRRGLPIAESGLAEEPNGGIPGRVGARGEPPPIGHEGEKHPGGFAPCAGKMSNAGVDGDDQIECGDEGGGIGKVLEFRGEIEKVHAGRRRLGLGCGLAFLKADKGHTPTRCQWGEVGESGGTFAVVQRRWAAGPNESCQEGRRGDAERGRHGGREAGRWSFEAGAPARDERWVREEVRDFGGHLFEGGSKQHWQAQEWAVDVEWGKRLAIGNPLLDAEMVLGGEELVNFGLAEK